MDVSDALAQIDNHLSCPCQNWLLGAGVSLEAGIPLMTTLTTRIFALLDGKRAGPVITAIKNELPASAHIEHVLSQLIDYITISERSRSGEIIIGGVTYTTEMLSNVHHDILQVISDIVRWGYVPANPPELEKQGSYDNPIVSVDDHLRFVKGLFVNRRAGLGNRRKSVKLFTTNYDTLIEDALALANVEYYDGFSGGAVAFWNHPFGTPDPEEKHDACVIKLHGSIDWRVGVGDLVRRVRLGDAYPVKRTSALIYPQASKYLATQRDPFATQFDRLRRALSSHNDNILGVCGYSFGDDHVNAEIQVCMQHAENKTTLLAFVNETAGKPPEVLEKWKSLPWGERVFVATDARLFHGTEELMIAEPGKPLAWWTFRGLTKFLQDGTTA